MTAQDLQNKLHTQIPMTKLMGLELIQLDNHKLITKAPLDININDKGTAFGGSLSTMTIISSWCIAYLIANTLKLDETNIVIKSNETQFKRPVTKDLVCLTYMPTPTEIDELHKKIKAKKSGSIKIYSQICENEKVCVNFEGIYVIAQK